MATVTPQDLRAFIPRMLERVFVEGVVFGNATLDEVRSLVDTITSKNKGMPLEEDLRFDCRYVNLAYGVEFRHSIPATNPDDENAAIESSFQVCVHSKVFTR